MLGALWAALWAWTLEVRLRARQLLRRLRRPFPARRLVLDFEVRGLHEAAATARRLADELEDAAASADRLPAGLRRELERGVHGPPALPPGGSCAEWTLVDVWDCLGDSPEETTAPAGGSQENP